MKEQYRRTERLLGADACMALAEARVAVFGIGGVGGYVAEAFARSGIGHIDLIDCDTVNETNINRQIIALHSTVGMKKTEAMARRIYDIDPDITVTCHDMLYLPETADALELADYDFVADAVDTVKAKLELIMRAQAAGVDIISCMGTGNKTDPTQLRVSDIYGTSVCPLARVMRYELRRRKVKRLTVVWSPEEPRQCAADAEETVASRRSVPASCAFVPAAAGLMLAAEAVKMIISK